MDSKEFIAASAEMTNFIVNYMDNIRERAVLPNVSPGYIRPLLPEKIPEDPDSWEDVMKDIERVIMPGMTHWQHPNFFAYFPTGSSYPSLLGDMLCGALASTGFSWISNPCCTELEVVMMDWLVELLGLPEYFTFKSKSGGGGIIQGTASESTMVALLAARKRKIIELKEKSDENKDWSSTLVAYASEQSHSSAERAAMLGDVKINLLQTDHEGALRGDVLEKAIQQDLTNGLNPFYVVATIGTTNMCTFDNLEEIGTVCKKYGIWVHVDAAYAGSALICEEFRYLIKGIELVDSFNFNPHKWLLVNFDCAAMWFKDSSFIVNAFKLEPIYLKHKNNAQEEKSVEYRHWQIPFGRRFRALKLWFVLRMYGRKKLQEHIRYQVSLAKQFEGLVIQDDRFEVLLPTVLGLVCFRLKISNEANENLMDKLNKERKIYLVPGKRNGTYFLRYSINSRFTNSGDVNASWEEILKCVQ